MSTNPTSQKILQAKLSFGVNLAFDEAGLVVLEAIIDGQSFEFRALTLGWALHELERNFIAPRIGQAQGVYLQDILGYDWYTKRPF